MNPELSVILPVYNAGKYLRAAIDSVLNQTFSDFELIVIDDASSDGSVDIIRSYNDHRIVFKENQKNLGLIKTLNLGLELCKGQFIARMDNDDISFPDRFEKQLAFLKARPEVGMVCSPVMGITPAGNKRDHWPADIENRTFEQLRATLPEENCIAHPTVMARAEVLKKYRYSHNQQGSEDWDLWLRMLRDGVRIEKTNDVLLYYRIHPSSTTMLSNQRRSPQLRTALVKWRFVRASVKEGKINSVVIRAFLFLFKDLVYHLRKRRLPGLMRSVRWFFTLNYFKARRQNRWLALTLSSYSGRHFFFFSYSHLGGAEKVHAAISMALKDQRPLVFFTGIHNKGGMEAEFGDSHYVADIAAALYHPLFARNTKKMIFEKIRSGTNPVIFGSNSSFFYGIAPLFERQVRVVDLVHDTVYPQNDPSPDMLVSFLRMDARVFISGRALNETRSMYRRYFVDPDHDKKLHLVYNGINIEGGVKAKNWHKPFTVLYVGRDSVEKRVNLVFELAGKVAEAGLPVRFVMAGEIRKPGGRIPNLELAGKVTESRKLMDLYHAAHFVIITSRSEGFPLSLMEGMAHGCIPLATPVGDIPHHLKTGLNAFLTSRSNAEAVAEEMFRFLLTLSEYDLEEMSRNARKYCLVTFSKEKFTKSYRALLGAS